MSAETITSDLARRADLDFADMRGRDIDEDRAHLRAYHLTIEGSFEWRSYCPFCEGPDSLADVVARCEGRVR